MAPNEVINGLGISRLFLACLAQALSVATLLACVVVLLRANLAGTPTTRARDRRYTQGLGQASRLT